MRKIFLISIILFLLIPFFAKGSVIINEFIPNPVGKDVEKEWIELYNDSDEVADISGWKLDDKDGGSKPFVFPKNTLIIPKGYLVFSRRTTKIALNNNGDKIRLFLPNGTLFQEISYGKTKEGQSISRTSKGFIWTIPTPGLPNKLKSQHIAQTKQRVIKNKSSKSLQQNYYNLANLEKSTKNNHKLALIIVTITAIIIVMGIGFIKSKKKS